MLLAAKEFLDACPQTWIARHAPEFPVVNVHALDIPAAPERIFVALEDPRNVSPGRHWSALFAFRWALGKLFGWDRGLSLHGKQPLEIGNHYTFFLIDHINRPAGGTPPYELGLSVENQLTRALVSFVISPEGNGCRVFNVTCAVFKGAFGKAYWRVIEPFHNGITSSMLATLRRKSS